MQLYSSPKQVLFDVFIAASIAAAVLITRFCLTQGIYEIFPYLYLLPIVLIAFSHPKYGIYGTVLVGWLYFMLVWLWEPSDVQLFTVATIQFYIFVSIGVLLSVYSQEYRREEQKRCNLYYNSQAGAFSFNLGSGLIMDTNPKFARMVRYDPAELKGKALADLVPDPAIREAFLSRLRDLKVVVDSELGLLSSDGTTRWILISSVRTDENEVVCTVIDITDRREEQKALSLANKKLTLLLDITRHDILNQVTGLCTAAELAKLRTTDPGMLQFIGQEEIAAQNIQRQIEFAKNYEGIGARSPQWQNTGIQVKALGVAASGPAIDVPAELDTLEIYADPMLHKVFENLIDNTLRHGERARRIRFSVDRDRGDDIALVYEDDGIGIPETDKERIFTKGFGKHTGLGLFLSREILAITGLVLKETGAPGKGARFEIRVPKGKFRFTGPLQPPR